MTPAEARAVLVRAQAGAKVALPAAEVSEKTTRVNGGDIKLTIVRRAARTRLCLRSCSSTAATGCWATSRPTNGWCATLWQARGRCGLRQLPPSPEAGYGVAIEQAYAATKWVAGHGQGIQVDGKRLAVAGNSVGGNMATVVALMAKEKGAPQLRSQVLLWPVTDANFDTPSCKHFASGHFLTKNMMVWFRDNYTTDAAARKQIYASPLRATITQLKGLPPTLIQTAEFDVLRDEAEAYGRKRDEAGVDVKTVRYNGMIHDFGLLNVISHLPATRSAMAQAWQ